MAGVGFTDFYDASVARQISVGGGAPMGDVLAEINFIKTSIDDSAATGLSVTITNATTMTQGQVYFEAWSDPTTFSDDAHKIARAKMDGVVSYFARLGYNVRRLREGVNNRFQWTVSW
jgi:hypothetical protein